MASSAAEATADLEAVAALPDGPVRTLMSKRLRALRKKYNRILQMEERVAEGKPLNKEQEEVLRSKPAVATLIDEYKRLSLPLASALADELAARLDDLVGLLYFGCLFDVKPQAEFTATMLARTHERGCCLTYDYVGDEDAAELLAEGDLDAISALGALVTSRPSTAGVSHKAALSGCLDHAHSWIRRSDRPIQQGAVLTYAGLREKLSKIMASDYFTATPEMKAPVDVAAAVGKYNVHVPEPTIMPSQDVQSEGSPELYQPKDEEQEDVNSAELTPDQYSPVKEEHPEDEAEAPNGSAEDVITTPQEEEQQKAEAEMGGEQSQREQQGFPRRGYHNPRGGIRGRRGYPNGRGGGRGGGRGYQNGRSQYYDPGYYPRNYYNARGRGGRSGGGPPLYENHGVPASGGRVPANAG